MDEHSRWPLWFLLFLPASVALFFIRPDNDWLRMFIRLGSLLLFLRFAFSLMACSEIFANMTNDAIGSINMLISVILLIGSIVLFVIGWTSGNDLIGISGDMSAAKKADLVVTSSIIFGVIALLYLLSLIFGSSIIEDWSNYDGQKYALLLGPWLVIIGPIINLFELGPAKSWY